MTPRMVDLSVSIDGESPPDPTGRAKITYYSHRQTAWGMTRYFPGLARKDLPDGEGWAFEKVRLSTHSGTHLDAPYHYASTMDGGKRAISIDEVPLQWCFQPAIKLDFRNFPDGYVATARDVANGLERIEHVLSPLDIVLVNTRAGAAYGRSDYIDTGCGMGREATLYLTERGVRVTGTDGWSWDAPFKYTAEKFKRTRDASLIWEGHRAGKEMGYCHMEKLHNLDKLPAKGFKSPASRSRSRAPRLDGSERSRSSTTPQRCRPATRSQQIPKSFTAVAAPRVHRDAAWASAAAASQASGRRACKASQIETERQ